MREHRWKKNELGNIDEFALDIQEDADTIPHHGPECEICGFSACTFCIWLQRRDIYNPEHFPCPGPPPEGKTWYFDEWAIPTTSIPDGTWEDD